MIRAIDLLPEREDKLFSSGVVCVEVACRDVTHPVYGTLGSRPVTGYGCLIKTHELRSIDYFGSLFGEIVDNTTDEDFFRGIIAVDFAACHG